MLRVEIEQRLLLELDTTRGAYLELRSRYQCVTGLCCCCPEGGPPHRCNLADARERYRMALAAFTDFVIDGVVPQSLTG